MVGADVHSSVAATVVICQLRDHRVGAFDGEHIKERSVTPLRNSSNLQRRQTCIALFNSGSDIPGHLHVEQSWICVLARLPAVVVQAISDARNLESRRSV